MDNQRSEGSDGNNNFAIIKKQKKKYKNVLIIYKNFGMICYIILLLIIIIIILFTLFNLAYILFYLFKQSEEYFVTVEKTPNNILKKIIRMLKDIDELFSKHNITYWIDGGTLLGAVRHNGIIPWDDDGDICVLKKDEKKMLSLIGKFNKMGYGFSSFWGGYKLFPLNGLDIKFKNRNWQWSLKDKELQIQENFNYKYPFIDIFIADRFDDKYHFTNKKVREIWKNYYHFENDLFPLKRYKFNDIELSGPNNPIPYLDRAYGNDWPYIGYKKYDHRNLRYLPIIKFKIKSINF